MPMWDGQASTGDCASYYHHTNRLDELTKSSCEDFNWNIVKLLQNVLTVKFMFINSQYYDDPDNG